MACSSVLAVRMMMASFRASGCSSEAQIAFCFLQKCCKWLSHPRTERNVEKSKLLLHWHCFSHKSMIRAFGCCVCLDDATFQSRKNRWFSHFLSPFLSNVSFCSIVFVNQRTDSALFVFLKHFSLELNHPPPWQPIPSWCRAEQR